MDRITQIQEELDKISSKMFNMIGLLQRDCPLHPAELPIDCWTPEQIQERLENQREFLKTCKIDHKIDFLIDSITEPEPLEPLEDVEFNLVNLQNLVFDSL